MKHIVNKMRKRKKKWSVFAMPRKKKSKWHMDTIYLLALCFVIALLAVKTYYTKEWQRDQKVLVAQMDNEIQTLRKENEELKTRPEKIVEVPKVVEKVVEKTVKIENSSKIRELRKIIIEKNIELDNLRDQCRR